MTNQPNVSSKEVGYRIQVLIINKGDSIPDVAMEMGVSIGHFYKLLNGQYNISDKYLNWIAEKYNVDPVFLLYGKDYIREDKMVPFDERLKADLEHIKNLPSDNQNLHMINCMETMCEILKKRIY